MTPSVRIQPRLAFEPAIDWRSGIVDLLWPVLAPLLDSTLNTARQVLSWVTPPADIDFLMTLTRCSQTNNWHRGARRLLNLAVAVVAVTLLTQPSIGSAQQNGTER